MGRFQYPDRYDSVTVTIANGASVSAAVAVGGLAPIAVYIPDAMDGTNVLFSVGLTESGTFYPLRSDGTGAADFLFPDSGALGKYTVFSETLRKALASFPYFKFVTGTSHASQTLQTAQRTLTVIFGSY